MEEQGIKKEKFMGKIGLLPRIAITRPVTVIMLLLALLVVGYIAYTQIKLELFPGGFDYPWMGLNAWYQETNVEQVEKELTIPLEKMLRTVHGVQTVTSYVWSSGTWISIRFNNDTDMDVAYSEIRDRVDRVKPELPEEVERIRIHKANDDADEPVSVMVLVADSTVDDPYYVADNLFKRAAERIDGVAKVDLWGFGGYKFIKIEVDQNKVDAYGINLYQVIQSLRRDNFSIASGHVKAGNKKIYVRSVAHFKDYDEIRNYPIKGTNLRLKDIATVSYDTPKWRWYNRTDRKMSIWVEIYKEAQANTIEVCNAVEEAVRTTSLHPGAKGMQAEVVFSQGHYILESISNLTDSAKWGGFFAVLILLFFLRRIRMTLIVTLAIPLSILITLTFIYFYGWTLNIMTMMGLMICIGLVVDNSIVIIENIFRYKQMGYSHREASLYGASEVSLAVTMATMTTVVVFLPLILMGSDVGFTFFMQRIGIPVIVALLASLLVALLFIPLATTKMTKTKLIKEPWLIQRSMNLYDRLLKWTLAHRLDVLLILLLLIVSAFMVKNTIATTDQLQGNINDVRLWFDLPSNYSIERSREYFTTVEDSLDKYRDKYGVRMINVRYGRTRGRIQLFLKENTENEWWRTVYYAARDLLGIPVKRPMEREEIVEDVKKHIPLRAGIDFRTDWRRDVDNSAVSVSLYGKDMRHLIDLSEEVERRLRTIPDLSDIDTELEHGDDEVHVIIDRNQARKYGLTISEIAGTVSYALRGVELPDYRTEDKEIDVRIQVRESDRETLGQLKAFKIRNRDEKDIPLGSVARFSIKKAPDDIRRENGKTQLSVTAITSKDNAGKLFEQIDRAMGGFQMPRGYTWSKGHRYERMQESDESQQFALILAITFVFLLMGVLFESVVLPLVVIISIGLSFIGVVWTLFLTSTPMDVMGWIGMIILVGVVVNNAIVLVDFINRLRNSGMTRYDAIIEAGKHRFRPILMTAFTTIFGLLPMVVGSAKVIGISYSPLGRVMAGGLLTATFLTLLVVPWAYTLMDDFRIFIKDMHVRIYNTMFAGSRETLSIKDRIPLLKTRHSSK
ncbi:efflux RND transporter permease subunit [candidate division KSB1 bacterium]|nr:efflux RND transporter permease subunit [candidate division KSB1 bacterium]